MIGHFNVQNLREKDLTMAEVFLERLADGMEEATINHWYFEEGDTVEEGNDLLEVTSEEGTFRIPSSCAGILGEVYFVVGEVVSVGEILCEIEKE